jgi:hypothetical protein
VREQDHKTHRRHSLKMLWKTTDAKQTHACMHTPPQSTQPTAQQALAGGSQKAESEVARPPPDEDCRATRQAVAARQLSVVAGAAPDHVGGGVEPQSLQHNGRAARQARHVGRARRAAWRQQRGDLRGRGGLGCRVVREEGGRPAEQNGGRFLAGRRRGRGRGRVDWSVELLSWGLDEHDGLLLGVMVRG